MSEAELTDEQIAAEYVRLEQERVLDQAADELERWLNRNNILLPNLIPVLERRMHRTLQQRLMQGVLLWIKHLASLPATRYDERNSASVFLAQKLESRIDDATQGTWHLPLV